MNDKDLMENILQLNKGVCSLFLSGTQEASTTTVHQAFCAALNDTLRMQDTLYGKMSEKGWYSAEQAEQTKIDALKQKFSGQ